MTSQTFLPSLISAAKKNAFEHGVREVVSDSVAIAFLTWRSQQGYASLSQIRNYWAESYGLAG